MTCVDDTSTKKVCVIYVLFSILHGKRWAGKHNKMCSKSNCMNNDKYQWDNQYVHIMSSVIKSRYPIIKQQFIHVESHVYRNNTCDRHCWHIPMVLGVLAYNSIQWLVLLYSAVTDALCSTSSIWITIMKIEYKHIIIKIMQFWHIQKKYDKPVEYMMHVHIL